MRATANHAVSRCFMIASGWPPSRARLMRAARSEDGFALLGGDMKSRTSCRIVSSLLLGTACTVFSLAHAGDVSLSVNVATPGVYGQITLGGMPPPEVLLPQPVVAVPAPPMVSAPPPEPLYLHVPPGYEKHWGKHCREYNACGRPVYFVSDRWYHDVYTPHHQEEEHGRGRHEEDHGHGHGHDHDHDHDHGHDRD